MTKSLELSEKFEISPEVVFRDVQGEEVILDLKSGIYFGLDEVGALIWKLLAEGAAVSKIVEALTAEYRVSEEKAEEDILRLVKELRRKGLLI